MDQRAAEFRKIVLVGLVPDLPDAELRDERGVPLVLPEKFPVKARAAFWLPQRPPYQRCAGRTEVADAKPFEREALRAGVIAEEVHEFTFPEMPNVDELRRRLMPVWEGLVAANLGQVPNGAPVALNPKPSLQFGLRGVAAGGPGLK